MKQFVCSGFFSSVCYDRLDYEEAGDPIPHTLLDGGTLWEIHGTPEGYVVGNIELSPGDWVLCCYPKRVKQRYPFASIACDDYDGVVKAVYDWYGDEQYTVTCEPVL